MTDKAEQVLAGLTPPQRDTMCNSAETFGGEHIIHANDARTGKALHRKGLTQEPQWNGRATLTKMGEEVSAILKKGKTNG